MKFRVATRKSALALAQTTMAADAIVKANVAFEADLAYELVPMTTEGDRRLDKTLASFGGKGVFIKELEIALLEKRADIAIHSLKDMPAEVLPEFKLAAVLEREDPRDAFLAKGGAQGVKFMELPAGAKVGTGSVRRVVQLKALRPDLEYVPIRGNIQTRISKLAELDGVVLAAAGLKRMGLADQVTEYFSTEQMLPASGQGILAIETLRAPKDNSCGSPSHDGANLASENSSLSCSHGGANPASENSSLSSHPERSVSGVEGSCIEKILACVNHADTYCIAVAEMAYLKALNAGCQFPVASFAEFVPGTRNLGIRGIYWDEQRMRLLRAEATLEIPASEPDSVAKSRELGVLLAEKIREQLAH